MINKTTTKQYLKRSCAFVGLDAGMGDALLLTFDDGPHPDVTPAVLRLLREHKARAIFFVVGSRIERAPHLLRAILDEGHEIGNHSFSHPNERQPWLVPYYKDLALCQEHVAKLTGSRPKFFRPPRGQLSVASVLAPRMLGMKTVLWSIDSGDWRLWDKDAEAAGAAALRIAESLAGREKRNDVVLMHDDHPHVLTVLETLLPELARRGCDLSGGLEWVRRN
jgi:peptidoglycan/xylan/chitin deacetylase (PgdA/CDA1 family)